MIIIRPVDIVVPVSLLFYIPNATVDTITAGSDSKDDWQFDKPVILDIALKSIGQKMLKQKL